MLIYVNRHINEKKYINFKMNKFLTVLSICILFFTHIIRATANCSGGECEFTNSNHYKYVKTYSVQTLNFEEVETDSLHFTI